MSKYISSSAIKKIALVSGILALVNGLIGLAVAAVPLFAFLACFITPLLCVVGLVVPGWAAYHVIRDKGYTKDQLSDALIASLLAGAVSGAVTGTVGAIFGIINSVVGAGATAAYSSLGGLEDITGDLAVSAGAGVLGNIICAPFQIIVSIIIAAVIAAVVGLVIAAITESSSAKPAMDAKPVEKKEEKKDAEKSE